MARGAALPSARAGTRRASRNDDNRADLTRLPLLITAVTTVRNEARNIAALLDSLVIQEPPLEVIIVDAGSEDATRDIVRGYESKYDFVHLFIRGGTRGAGRNFGIGKARGEGVAFIDGDAIANPFWPRAIRDGPRTSG